MAPLQPIPVCKILRSHILYYVRSIVKKSADRPVRQFELPSTVGAVKSVNCAEIVSWCESVM